jgi:hypothetical protein
MGKQAVWQKIIVDWDTHLYAMIDPLADEEDWTGRVSTEKKKGRDIHCFHHDADDASGLRRWAEQHHVTRTEISAIMPFA